MQTGSDDAFSLGFEEIYDDDGTETMSPSSELGKTWLYEYLGNLFPNMVSHIVLGFNDNGVQSYNVSVFERYISEIEVLNPKTCVLVFINMKTASHANVAIIDSLNRTIEIFEPNGSAVTTFKREQSMFSDVAIHLISEVIKREFNINFSLKYVKECPSIGVQIQEQIASSLMDIIDTSRTRNIGGYCMVWSCMFIHYHLLNPSLNHDEIYSLLVSRFSSVQLSTRVMKYFKHMVAFFKNRKIPAYRSNVLSRADLGNIVNECQKFIRSLKTDDIKSVDTLTGTVFFKEAVTNEKIYELCGIRDFIFTYLVHEKGADRKKIENFNKYNISTIQIIQQTLMDYESFLKLLQ